MTDKRDLTHLIHTAVNLTPHDITYCDAALEVVRTFPASGKTARVIFDEPDEKTVDLPDGTRVRYAEAPLTPSSIDFPPADDFPGVRAFIVSLLVAENMWETLDGGNVLLVPDTNPSSVVRDLSGGIKGVRRFLVFGLEA